MSARDDLIALLEDKCRAIGHDPGKHVDAFAHELAEAIRAHDVATVSDDAKEMFDRAAALIDPGVSSD